MENKAIISINEIATGVRHRKNVQEIDISDIQRSIEAHGLISPITIRREDNLLLAGEIRLTCLKNLGITEPIENVHFRYFDDGGSPVGVEFGENVYRKDFLPSERVDIARALEEEQKLRKEQEKEARRRAAKGTEEGVSEEPHDSDYDSYSGQDQSDDEDYENAGDDIYEEEPPTKQRKKDMYPSERIAKSVGWSPKTLKKAKDIVAAAEENPDRYQRLKENMDATGSVDQIHSKLVALKTAESRKNIRCTRICFFSIQAPFMNFRNFS